MRAYYLVTNAEQDRTNYRNRLHEYWQTHRPDFNRDPQQLSDQIRSVIRRKVLSEAELQELKTEAILLVSGDTGEEHQEPTRSHRRSTVYEIRPEEIPAELSSALESNLMSYAGIPLENRPRLQKIKYSKTAKETVIAVNKAMEKVLATCTTIEDTCHLVYCAAYSVLEMLGTPPKRTKKRIICDNQEPPWVRRLKFKISTLRKEVGRIHAFFNTTNPSSKIKRVIVNICKKLKTKHYLPEATKALESHLENLKQRIRALANRLRRYTERVARYTQNLSFQRNQRLYYRSLEERQQNSEKKIVGKDQMYEYWERLWGNSKVHDRAAYWIEEERERMELIREMPHIQISVEDTTVAINKLANWRSPGCDNIQAYWWKHFNCVHSILSKQFNEALENPSKIPPFFTEGITYLLPKNKDVDNPQNFRPITCLPVGYKIFTSIIAGKINDHLTNNNIMAWQQNGCKAKAKGSKEWLILDSVVANHARVKKRNLSVAWIDYRKAFDSVPHSWLIQVLEVYKIDEGVVGVLKHLMSSWKTSLTLDIGQVHYKTSEVQIKRGIFQGDSLSPLWFCMAVNPLSTMLESSTYGYIISRRPALKMSHLLFMDDLKVYAANPEQLKGQLELVSKFSRSISMEFGLEKCAFVHIKGGKIQNSSNITLLDSSSFTPLPLLDKYKYLGIQQTLNIDHKETKKLFEDHLKRRLNLILKSYLYSSATTTAINTWVMPIVKYSFGIVKWSPTDLDNLDRLIRTTLTKNRQHHPNSSVSRLYVPRDRGGRGMKNLKQAHNKECEKLFTYLKSIEHPIYIALARLDENLTPLNLARENPPVTEKKNYTAELEETWKGKELHGRFYAMLHANNTDAKMSTLYLSRGVLMMETEGFLSAIQDQVIATRNYRRYILHQEIPTDLCRMCHERPESIQHLTSGCSYLAPKDHKNRHDDVAKVFHQEIMIKYGKLTEKMPYYKYQPKDQFENDEVRVYWDKTIITDKQVLHNRPDILLIQKLKKEAQIIDITIPNDHNIGEARTTKLTKYIDLAHEIKAIYQLKQVSVHPLIISANGLVELNLKKELTKIGLNEVEKTILTAQKAAILGTCRTVRRVLTND